MFGELPAWGFYVRHANGITIKNSKLAYKKEDFRAAMVFDDVNDLKLQIITVASGKQLPVIVLNNTKNVKMSGIKLPVQSKQAITFMDKK